MTKVVNDHETEATLAMSETLIFDMGFPERLAAIRKRKKLTQKGLAELAGVSHIQAHRYEIGASQPTLDVIKRLAVALGVSGDELLFDNDERGPGEDLKLQFEAISRFDAEEKTVVKKLLDSLILSHEAKRLFGASVGDEAVG